MLIHFFECVYRCNLLLILFILIAEPAAVSATEPVVINVGVSPLFLLICLMYIL